MKLVLFFIIILLLNFSCKEVHSDSDRELVIKHVGFKKKLYEKYYKIKDKKNSFGEDILDGVRITYYENGKVNGISNYSDGILNGWEIIFENDGRKLQEILWEANSSSTTTKTKKIINYNYYGDCKLASIDVCDKDGKVISNTSYDRKGNIIP